MQTLLRFEVALAEGVDVSAIGVKIYWSYRERPSVFCRLDTTTLVLSIAFYTNLVCLVTIMTESLDKM